MVLFVFDFMHLNNSGDFPDGPVVKTLRFHCMGSRDQSLVGEPRSWMLHGMAGKKKKNPQFWERVSGLHWTPKGSVVSDSL